ncbi:MAG TPA: hypothetical protein VL549_01795 [Gemmatimonadales bacterium]|nr:hypothetical protein [Gemmatimonadales bacterium]
MRSLRMVFLLAAAGSFWLACSSSSSGPAPTLAGTWHVTFGAMYYGGMNPSSFDAGVTPSGDTFHVTLPSLAWSIGPVTFDSAPEFVVTQDSFVLFDEMIRGSAHVCDFVSITGIVNRARDTVRQATVVVGDTDNTGVYVCKPKSSGPATVTKVG